MNLAKVVFPRMLLAAFHPFIMKNRAYTIWVFPIPKEISEEALLELPLFIVPVGEGNIP